MKQNFRGWTSVYAFTFRQATKGMGFKVVTTLVTFLIIGIIVLVNILAAKPEKDDTAEVSPIKSVYVLDNSGLQPTSYKEMNPELSTEQFKNIKYVAVADQSRDEVIKTAAADSDKSIAVIITTTEKGYEIEAAVPAGSTITIGQANKLLTSISAAFESSKLMQSGLSTEQLTAVLMPEVTSYSNIGENNSEITFVIKLIAPMIFSLMLYMMLILYGQTISKSVSTEKTSKLMETLLTSIHPYALISGKILAVTSMALLQFVTWIIAGFVGLYGGNAIAHSIYPDYQNTVINIINFLKDNIGETALTIPSVILAVLFFCVGFLFYCVLAGLAGCMVSKPEDAASTQQLFVFPILISWLVVYFAPLSGNYGLLKIARYIPFTSPFCVPVDLITGTIGPVQGIITLTILTVFTFLFIMLSGRIYKGLILYTGQKLSLKTIGNVLKSHG
ncbi:MAG: ABC transporter permease [Herbinix sp.]|nr:ABC transporter permease [Herbinix sp.]